MSTVTWVLESDVFPETHQPLRDAILDQGHTLLDWRDQWWTDGVPSRIPTSSVVFHGSLGNASLIGERLEWSTGAFCPTDAFRCSSWYESARKWLLHTRWHFAPANELVANASSIGNALGSPVSLFVRPDSPLKPFSGRVVDVESLTLAKLDHGFYYEDDSLPVLAAPLQRVGDEWRFVIVGDTVVTGSAYDPATRSPVTAALDSEATKFAATVASDINAPSEVYILDIGECDGALRLIELNPFGGADLYACDAAAVVEAVSRVTLES